MFINAYTPVYIKHVKVISGIRTCFCILKIKCSKFTRGWEPLQGDALSAKSFEVLTLIFSTDCSPIDWLQSVLKITRFENVFLFYFFFENQASRSRGGEIELVWGQVVITN